MKGDKQPVNNLFDLKQTEAEITKEIRQYLKLRGVFHYKQWQGLGSLPGVSDIIGCYNGRYLAIEVKRKGQNPTEKQQAFLDTVNAQGGLAFVARSVEDVMERLR